MRERLPGADIRQSAAEQLPFPDAAFDAALAQLVVHFMADPVLGLREMGRVTWGGGVVAASVWDHACDRGPLAAFWRAAAGWIRPHAMSQSPPVSAKPIWPGSSPGPGSARPGSPTLTVRCRHATFEQRREPFTLGVGPAGGICGAPWTLSAARALRERCRDLLPEDPVEISATAWAATGRA